MPFDTDLLLQRIACDRWRLLAPLIYEGAQEKFVVPEKFVTDLASVPQVFQSILPRTGLWDEAACVHDLLCVDLGRWRLEMRAGHPHPDPPLASARDTDGIFRRIAKESGVGPVRRWLLWTGVRLGALANPARRAGWLRDAPAVAAITALALAVLAAALLGLGALVDLLVWG